MFRYQNKRLEYTEAFFSVINWEKVGELYKTALKQV
jgi:superoxide dismutase